jgi:hypothetical protein
MFFCTAPEASIETRDRPQSELKYSRRNSGKTRSRNLKRIRKAPGRTGIGYDSKTAAIPHVPLRVIRKSSRSRKCFRNLSVSNLARGIVE